MSDAQQPSRLILPESSRRNFLKTSGIVTGAALAGGALTRGVLADIPASRHIGGDDEIKIALIGCGGRGTGACSQALSTKGKVKLVAMGDAFKDRLDGSHNGLKNHFKDRVDVPEENKFVGFDAYEKVMALPVDLVILATPPGFRPIHFEAAVKAGKHVFMEKPVATDAAGVRKVIAAAEEAKQKDLKVGVGLQRRHDARYIDTVKRLHDGAIGDIIAMRVYWNGQTPWVNPRKPGMTEMEYQMRNWYYFVWICGDHIVEQHIHNLDVAYWVKNALPVAGNGMGGREVRKGKDYGETFDHHCVELEYADGSRVFSQCRHIPGCWSPVEEHAHGSKGYSNVGGSYIKSTDGEWHSNAAGHDPYQVEHDDLFAAIREGKPYNEAKRGAESTMMAIFGRMLTYSGERLTWDQAINSNKSVMPKEYSFQATPPTVPDADGNYAIPVPGKTKVV